MKVKAIKSLFHLILLISLSFLPVGCSDSSDSSGEITVTHRGQLISADVAASYSSALLAAVFSSYGITVTPDYGIRAYRAVYGTVDLSGTLVKASGVIIVPDGAAGALPLMGYQHGTVFAWSEAPSVTLTEGIPQGSRGYVTVVADYLGFGSSKGIFHPYHIKNSYATAVVDLLRAARVFCEKNGVSLNGDVFLAGYSEGGFATLAVQKHIEENLLSEFNLVAVMAGPGAYDLNTTAEELISGPSLTYPAYLAYILKSYNSVYSLADGYSFYMKSPYYQTIDNLFNGYNTGSDINAALTTVTADLITADFISLMQGADSHEIKDYLSDNSLHQWVPVTPTHLYHGGADTTVPPSNTDTAYTYFDSNSSTTIVRTIAAGLDHGDGGLAFQKAVTDWFESYR